jgi:amino acid transporter
MWNTGTFFSYYTMVILCPLLYGGWKIVKRTKMVKPHEADLVWERPVIDAYEAALIVDHVGFWDEVMHMMGLRKKRTEHVE